MELSIETIEFLLLVAAIVAMLARRFRLPYSMGSLSLVSLYLFCQGCLEYNFQEN